MNNYVSAFVCLLAAWAVWDLAATIAADVRAPREPWQPVEELTELEEAK